MADSDRPLPLVGSARRPGVPSVVSKRVPNGPLVDRIEPKVLDAASDAAALERKAGQVAKGAARAGVLGVNDGLVSTLCLILGVAGADASQGSVRLAGFAALVAGAFSMAAGEWISVRSQIELFQGVLVELRRLLQRNPRLVLDRLVESLTKQGFNREVAQQISTELPLDQPKFFSFAARTIFNLDPDELGSPVTAAVSSLGLFSLGALVPLLPWFFVAGNAAVALSIVGTAVVSLGVGGWIGSSSGGSPLRTGLRQLGIVALAASVTYGIGRLFGTAVS